MKYIIILLLAIVLISCKKKKPNEFSLDVKVNGDYKGYLYLDYDDKKDSSKISNGKAFFKGTVAHPIDASYSTNSVSANDKNFYLENEKIKSEITITKKQINDYNIDWIAINRVSGTKTALIEKDFEEYQLKYSSNKDWSNKLYEKLQKIIKQYPEHRYSGDLLSYISHDTLLSKVQLSQLYHMLNIKFQDPYSIKNIASKAFPEYKIKVSDSIYDFELPNKEEDLISTKDFRGRLLFIDFWASWCKPCRDQFPGLTVINSDFEQKGFTILGVSIDEKEDAWLKAVAVEKPKWENVIDKEGLTGELAKKYGVFSVPYNVLVDENGKVIANDMSLEELRKVLDSILSTRKEIADKDL